MLGTETKPHPEAPAMPQEQTTLRAPMGMPAIIFLFSLLAILSARTPVLAAPWMTDITTIANTGDWEQRSAVAYDPYHQVYLVVWEEWQSSENGIFGILVGADGIPVGAPFLISGLSTFSVNNPDVAFDYLLNRFLVVWAYDYSGDGSDLDIQGRFIPWDGPTTEDPVFFVYAPSSTSQTDPAITYNGRACEFLVTWTEENASTHSIWGRLISWDGVFVTGGFTVISGIDGYWNSQASWSDGALLYLVVFERWGQTGDPGIYGTFLNYDGTINQASIGIADWPVHETGPDVESVRGDFLVTWIDEDNDTAYSRTISKTGSGGPLHMVAADALNYSPSVSCCDLSQECLVTGGGPVSTSGWKVWAVVTELDGSPLYELTIDEPTDGRIVADPAPHFGAPGKILVTWEANTSDGTQQFIRGRLVGDRLFGDGFESGGMDYW